MHRTRCRLTAGSAPSFIGLRRAFGTHAGVGIGLSSLLALALLAPRVHAQAGSNAALAETLYQEGRHLMAEKKYDEACPKFAESQRLDPGTGTLLNLAVCHESQGRIATAWAELNEALAGAHRDGRPDREKFARDHIAAIEPKLSRLTIEVAPNARVAGLEVKLDGAVIGPAAWGVATPVDPGPHELVATAAAAGRSWSKRVEVPSDAVDDETLTVTPNGIELSGSGASLPSNASEPAGPPPPNAPVAGGAPADTPSSLPPSAGSPPPSYGPPNQGGLVPGAGSPRPVASDRVGTAAGGPAGVGAGESAGGARAGRRTAAYVVGGLGIASVAVGSVFGLRAFSRWHERNADCAGGVCTEDAVTAGNQAKDAARVADIACGAGVVAVAVGAVLLLTSRSSPPAQQAQATDGSPGHKIARSLTLGADAGPEGATLRLGGFF